MKILVISSEIGEDSGGLALSCKEMKENLEALGNEVYLSKSFAEDEAFPLIKTAYDATLSEKIQASYFLKSLAKKYKKEDIKLIIAYGASKNAYFASLLAKKLKKDLFIVLCGSDINLAFGDFQSYNYNYFALKYAKKILALSQELLENSKIIYEKHPSSYFLLPNLYNFEENITYKEIDFEKISFALASTFLNEKKGIAKLLKAFAHYCKNYKRKADKLYLIGKIDEDLKQYYKKLISDLVMEDNIILLSYLKREAYIKYFENIDIYLQASPFEGCSNALGEAIENGKFLLLSDTGYFYELLKDDFPFLIFENFKVENFSQALNSCVETIKKHDYRKEVRTFLSEIINKENIFKKWEKALEEKPLEFKEHPSVLAVMFHDVENSFTGLDYHKKAFEELAALVHSKGYKFTSYENYMKSEDKSKLIICTFDDAYEGVYNNAFEVLKKYDFTATVFLCPDLIGKSNDWNRRDNILRQHMNLEMLKKLKKAKWELASHGLGHYNMLRLSQSELEKSLGESKKFLEEHFGKQSCFCYPFGDFNAYVKNLVSKYYDFAFSVDIGGNDLLLDRYQFRRLVPEQIKKIMENI